MVRPDWSNERIENHIRALACWNGAVEIEPLIGGLCNKSFVVTDETDQYVARIGSDIPIHGIVQSSVQNSMKAAAEIGVTPMLRHLEPGLAVVDFLEGGCLRPEDMEGNEENCQGIVRCLKELHAGSDKIRGPLTYFWPFQVVRHYAAVGFENNSRLVDLLPDIGRINDLIEQSVDPYIAVFTHNDTVPQNFMFDDNGKVWLIDWDYGGYGHPMFDLVGVSCNADLSPASESQLFEMYFDKVTEELERELIAFKLVLNLREYLWGMVQEVTSELDSENVAASMTDLYPDQEPGYVGYTNMNRERFESNWEHYQGLFE